MSVSRQDVKLLWSRAAGLCSICRCKLTQRRSNSTLPIGDEAHIVAAKPDGPRGSSALSSKERDSYDNLILLCPNDHRTIDSNIEEYPAERLYMVKSRHERWVQESLDTAQLQNNARLRPVSHLLIEINDLTPLLYWLHSSVPANKADHFLGLLQLFWYSPGIAVEDIDHSLRKGMDFLLRPLASGHFINVNDQGYTKEHISLAYKSIATCFSHIEFDLPDRMDIFEADTILDLLDYELNLAHQKRNLLDAREQSYVRFALCVTEYFLASLKAGELLDIPEKLVREFLALTESFFNQLGFSLPDSVDSTECQILRDACGIYSD